MKKSILFTVACFMAVFYIGHVMAADKKTPMGTLSAVGGGNVDLSGYVQTSALTNYAAKTDLSSYATKTDLSSYATTSSVSDAAATAAANVVADAMNKKFDKDTGIIKDDALPTTITALPDTVNKLALSDVSTREIAQTNLTEEALYIWAYDSKTKTQGWVKIDSESINFQSGK